MRSVCLAVLISLVLSCEHGDARAQEARGAGDQRQSDDIVVTAPRRGEAEVAAETELGEEEIASYGADSIDELIDRLAPLIGASGEEPVILVNGQDIGFDLSILGYPAEALSRIAVLKAEAAAHYGHPSGRRVVNLVLKRNYASRHAEASVSWATAGGQYGGNLTAGQVAIAGDVRWNVQARISLESALRKSARDVPIGTGPVDLVGYLVPSGRDEIDPALSAIAGEIVAVAAIPAEARTGAPTLEDFAADPSLHPADPATFETLLPSRRNISLNLGASRPLGPFNASVSLNASSNHSSRLRGLPMASVIVLPDSPWSPFSDEVLLVRPLAGDRALLGENGSRSLAGSLTLSGTIGSWRTSISASYARSWADNRLERGIDTSRVQDLIDPNDRSFNPYGPWSERLLLVSGSRSDSESFGARFNVAKTIVDLPAGALTTNFSANGNHSSSGYRRLDEPADVTVTDRNTHDHLSGELSFSIPVSHRGEDGIGPLGDLVLDLSVGGQTASGSGLRKQYGGGFTWSPVSVLEVLGSFEHREVVPSSEQLGAPHVETIKRIYDFSRGEVAEPVWITGGNPLLRRGSRQSLSLDVRVRPLDSQMLTVNVGYRQNRAEGGIAPFPELTPIIEAAFPERVVRDAEGRLASVDARAINIARNQDTELVSGVALRLPDPGRGAGEGQKRAADPLRFTLSLSHTWRLKSELLTRPDVPVIDQLAQSGQSRHFLSLQAVAGKKGMGADVRATWRSPARVSSRYSSAARPDYRYEPPLLVDLGLFIVPDKVWPMAEETGWLENLKVSLDIDNLLDTYRRVRLADGSIPRGYSRYEIDPLGRTIELSMRKRF